MRHSPFFVLIALVLFSACAPAPSAPSPTLAPPVTAAPKAAVTSSSDKPLVAAVKAGNWKATGDNGFLILFTMGEGGSTVVNGFQLTFNTTCGSHPQQINDTAGATQSVSLKAGEIRYSDASYEISGKAVAVDRIEGTLKVAAFSIGKGGQCSAADFQWTASPM